MSKCIKYFIATLKINILLLFLFSSCSSTGQVSSFKSTHSIKNKKLISSIIEDVKEKSHIDDDNLEDMIISIVAQKNDELKVNILPLTMLMDTYNNNYNGYSSYKYGLIVFWGEKTNKWIDPNHNIKRRELFIPSKLIGKEIYIPTFARGVEHYFFTYKIEGNNFKLITINNKTPEIMISNTLLNYYK